jgi:alpha-L-fucosidase
MFIHFNMATFNNRQWATGTEDPATFAPSKLDCGQWLDAAAAAAAGMKYAVLTVKRLREIGARLAAPQPVPDKP